MSGKKKKKNNNYFALEKERAKERENAYREELKKEKKNTNATFVIGLILSITAMIFAIADLFSQTDTHRLVYGIVGGIGFIMIGASYMNTRKTYALICAGIGLVLLFSTSGIIIPYLQALLQ